MAEYFIYVVLRLVWESKRYLLYREANTEKIDIIVPRKKWDNILRRSQLHM